MTAEITYRVRVFPGGVSYYSYLLRDEQENVDFGFTAALEKARAVSASDSWRITRMTDGVCIAGHDASPQPSQGDICLMLDPFRGVYVIDAAFIDRDAGATLLSRHATAEEASRAACAYQLEDSRRVREDFERLGGKRMIASIYALSVRYEAGSRLCIFYLRTPSGGTLLHKFSLRQFGLFPPRALVDAARKPGNHLLETPIPVTLRLFEDPVRRDPQVAFWQPVETRRALRLPRHEIRLSDILVIDSHHWLVRDITSNGVSVTPFRGLYGDSRNEQRTEISLEPDTTYTVERPSCPRHPRPALQMPAPQPTTLK